MERSEKAALERILQKEKDLMDSAIQREMGRAASLHVELLAARQQRVHLDSAVIHASGEWRRHWHCPALLCTTPLYTQDGGLGEAVQV